MPFLPNPPALPGSPDPGDVVGGSASPETGHEIVQGDLNMHGKTNANLAASNIGFGGLAGAYCVLSGLTVTAGSGLTANIADGYAAIDGVVGVSSLPAYVLPASQAEIYLWLKQDGTLTHTVTTTPPSGKVCLLSRLATSGSAVTSVDTNIAFRSLGGALWRTTPDASTPSDTPGSATREFRKTNRGGYVWTGSEWCELPKVDSFPRWWKFTVPYTDLQAAALTKTITLKSLPAGSVVHAAKVRVATALSGASISALALDLGKAGTPAAYAAALNGLATGSGTYGGVSFESDAAATDLQLKATATGANLSALTAGSVEVHVLLSVAL